VKPRVRAKGTLTEDQICAQLEDGPIFELQRYLEVAESLMAPEGYAFGDRLSWADFFLYPIMADLKTVPEWELVSKRLQNWTEKMEMLPEVQATRVGTLAAGAQLCGIPRKNGRILCSMPIG
jgi:glutathione S-transferase